MNQNTILEAINYVLSGNAQNMNPANQWLLDNATNTGYALDLIIISDNKNHTRNQRQFALNEFSRIIKDHWRPKN